MTTYHPSERFNAVIALPQPKVLLHQEGKTWEQLPSRQEPRREDSSASILLVPLDGSLHAEHALPHALAIARRSGAVVRIVHVHSRLDHHEPWQMHSDDETKERRRRAKRDYLHEVSVRIAWNDSVRVEPILIDSLDTEDSLLKAAEGADLVVMASHRRGFLRRFLSYSISDALRRRLHIPVLLVRGYSLPVDLTSDPLPRQILIPLDGSTFAERVLRPAIAIGRLEGGATLTLLDMRHDESTDGTYNRNSSGDLSRIAHDIAKADPVVNTRIVTLDGPLTEAVTSFAEEHEIDLIALAARSDGGMTGLWRGGIADSLIQRTNLPMLLLGTNVEHERAEPSTL